jgi:Zn-dependent M32 family carboxypeptidase
VNKERRRRLNAVLEQLAAATQELEIIRDEEQEYYDNMPASFQDGEKGETAQEVITVLDDALSSLEELTENISTIEGVGCCTR